METSDKNNEHQKIINNKHEGTSIDPKEIPNPEIKEALIVFLKKVPVMRLNRNLRKVVLGFLHPQLNDMEVNTLDFVVDIHHLIAFLEVIHAHPQEWHKTSHYEKESRVESFETNEEYQRIINEEKDGKPVEPNEIFNAELEEALITFLKKVPAMRFNLHLRKEVLGYFHPELKDMEVKSIDFVFEIYHLICFLEAIHGHSQEWYAIEEFFGV
ncbi:hypothetical protein [Desertivirga xinjiangensis]|uniref:hypothetical protein n=1 Tax=Desertivirga xinjiangensis TaxID=539206 RepID=UPI00210AE9C4|nr:hypothetical protein [Pedobacter xinjiangensis]